MHLFHGKQSFWEEFYFFSLLIRGKSYNQLYKLYEYYVAPQQLSIFESL